MRPTLLVLLAAALPAAAQDAPFTAWTPRPGDAYVVRIEREVRSSNTRAGGDEPVDPVDEVESVERRIRVRHLEGGRVELTWIEDDVRASVAVPGLAGRTIRASHPADGRIVIELVAGPPIDEGQSRAALSDAETFLEPDPRYALVEGRRAAPGDAWSVEAKASAGLFAGEDPATESEVLVQRVQDRDASAVFDVQVRLRTSRGEGPHVSESRRTGSGELAIDRSTGRIVSWTWSGTVVEEDRVQGEDGELVLSYEAREELRIEFAYGG